MSTTSIMARLKEATAEQHRHAESRPMQQAMARGELAHPVFTDYLGQLWLVHRSLETALDGATGSSPAVGAVYRPAHRHAPELIADLTHHGAMIDGIAPLTETQQLLDSIERRSLDRPVALLGLLYVLEGSMNGNRYIVRALAKTYGPEGLRYFDPYGDRQRDVWAQFRADMDELVLADSERDAIVVAAGEMFDGLSAISEALSEAAVA